MIPNASTSPESTRAITSWSVGVTVGKPRRAASGSHRGPCDGTRFHRGFPLEHRHAHRQKNDSEWRGRMKSLTRAAIAILLPIAWSCSTELNPAGARMVQTEVRLMDAPL